MPTCLHTLFEEQVKLHPDAIALTFEGAAATYQTINERANQLANYLIARGVKTGDRITISLKQSFEMIIGILGILKSGAAYVPLDPKNPIDRLRFMLDDAGAPFLVTQSDLIDGLPIEHVELLCLDTGWDAISRYATESPKMEIQDNTVAVLLYTSGTTGNPKGVLLSHRALVNRIVWDRETYKHNVDDVILQHSLFNFDFSIFEIFMALAGGGRLVLTRPEFRYESTYLIELIQRESITKLGCTPSLFKLYLNMPGFENCTSLKQVFLGGEVLEYGLQKTFFSKSKAELINIYGPTETSISVLNWICQREDKGKDVPIGYPVANMRVYLLDENMKKVPIGEIGEIYAAGMGVADGYHNRPELTASRFMPDPFVSGLVQQMYKTGDLGRLLPNGAFQFLGRKDLQIKLHGLRIELPEIEYHINSLEKVKDCVVRGIEHDGKLTLVAYIIPASETGNDFDEIRDHLLKKMPESMVPSMFIKINEFPLSPNGKIDRNALPRPENVRLLANNSYVPATHDAERRLVRIWEKVLHLKPIGVTDSFYKLGGDSLAAIEIHHIMEIELGNTLPISAFANAETIQEQVQIINTNTAKERGWDLIYVRSAGNKPPILFVGPVIGIGNFSDFKELAKYINHDHPLVCLPAFGMDRKLHPSSIESAAENYVQLLEKQYPQKEYILGGYSLGGLVAYEMAQILKSRGHDVNLLYLMDTINPKASGHLLSGPATMRAQLNFYTEKFIKGSLRTKLSIASRVGNWGIKRTRKIMAGSSIHKSIRVEFEEIMLALAKQYDPKPYNGNVLLISASEEYISQFSRAIWGKLLSNHLYHEEVLCDHLSLLHTPNNLFVADILNKWFSGGGQDE